MIENPLFSLSEISAQHGWAFLLGSDTWLTLNLSVVRTCKRVLALPNRQPAIEPCWLAVLRFCPSFVLCSSSSVIIVFHGLVSGNPMFPLTKAVSQALFEDRDCLCLSKMFHHRAMKAYAHNLILFIYDFPTLALIERNRMFSSL